MWLVCTKSWVQVAQGTPLSKRQCHQHSAAPVPPVLSRTAPSRLGMAGVVVFKSKVCCGQGTPLSQKQCHQHSASHVPLVLSRAAPSRLGCAVPCRLGCAVPWIPGLPGPTNTATPPPNTQHPQHPHTHTLAHVLTATLEARPSQSTPPTPKPRADRGPSISMGYTTPLNTPNTHHHTH